jgi:hypothetical protein
MDKLTCIFILSEKSSGSSMLWRSLTRALDIKRYPKTQHFENETLYWTKAASILELPQLKMLKSSVPYTKERSRSEIETFLSSNLGNDYSAYSDRDLVFKGWFDLITSYGPVFIEKSPHHLLQVSALNLMLEFKKMYAEEVDVKFIGLIRNPYITLCSQIRRWQPPVNSIMEQWKKVYMNLSELQAKLNHQNIYIVRYEQLISDKKQELENIFTFLNIVTYNINLNFDGVKTTKSEKSLTKFGFRLDDSSKYLARSYGYKIADIEPKPSLFWPFYKFYLYYIRGFLAQLKAGFTNAK